MFIFIRADSVLVRQRPPDSLMSGCPHITRPASERQLSRVEGGEEGGEEGRSEARSNPPPRGSTGRPPVKAAPVLGGGAKGASAATADSRRAEESHFCTRVCENRKAGFTCDPRCGHAPVGGAPQLCYQKDSEAGEGKSADCGNDGNW